MSTAESTPATDLPVGVPRVPRLRRLAEFEPPIEQPGLRRADLPAHAGPPAWTTRREPGCRTRQVTRPTADEMAALAGARTTLQGLMEVLDGRRPLPHLQPLFEPRAYQRTVTVIGQIRHRRAGSPHRSAARLRSLRACHAVPQVAEVSAVWECDGQVRALAARFEQPRRGHPAWRCTALLLA